MIRQGVSQGAARNIDIKRGRAGLILTTSMCSTQRHF
jgi:hypothetical protein